MQPLDANERAALLGATRQFAASRLAPNAARWDAGRSSTVETRSHLELMWDRSRDPSRFAVITDPGSALGIYAVTAYAAGRRVKEAGVRVALGATVPDVVRLFVRGTLGPVALGLVLGVTAGWAASRALLALVLDGVEVGTPMLLPAAALIAFVAVAAAVLPARRVAALDPVQSLRCD